MNHVQTLECLLPCLLQKWNSSHLLSHLEISFIYVGLWYIFVQIKFHNGQVHGVFHKKFSSFALFKGKHGASFIPYQVWPSFKPRDQDKKFIVALRQLLVDYELAGGSNKSLSLKELRVGRDLSLLCKVLQICEVENKPLLLIWDGTDTPPATIQSKLEDEMENPLPLQVEPFPLPRDILLSLPDAGTVLRLIVDEDHEVLGLHLLKTGRWVKFVDLNCELHAGLWHVKLMPYTKLRFVPNEDPLILESERYCEKRLSSKFGRMPLSSTPLSHTTVTNLEDVPFVTLTNILAHPQATAKFRCVVRVIAAIPWRIEDFRSPHGTYRIRLTLEDSTARLHAFVYSKDGETLFGDYPAAVDLMTKMRNLLLGITESNNDTETRNPPWIQCCIKSYYRDKNDALGSRCYRICDTKVRC
ncbi:protection of telomeres protein 1b-like isoform X2 [Diospyros lotus]|uniref:protection of telomeres protein 1b-like isoform X2 n=1 Tax=Diospyros lotus TaxID=55363 RepID=UPI00224CDEB2|nr:protection of telomeres protein 1b-like isoform X2 [Diospyros lotus]XP_052180747.1 protection of telomeres protein 1b-like isoform X2 [Diospyros lotus]XP_052180748.1 protection of telomeres protein 1b-like isoform X2 [Diospyros lotus]